jgi:hypothetical protein
MDFISISRWLKSKETVLFHTSFVIVEYNKQLIKELFCFCSIISPVEHQLAYNLEVASKKQQPSTGDFFFM